MNEHVGGGCNYSHHWSSHSVRCLLFISCAACKYTAMRAAILSCITCKLDRLAPTRLLPQRRWCRVRNDNSVEWFCCAAFFLQGILWLNFFQHVQKSAVRVLSGSVLVIFSCMHGHLYWQAVCISCLSCVLVQLACACAHGSAYRRLGKRHGIALVKVKCIWGPAWTKWVQYWKVCESLVPNLIVLNLYCKNDVTAQQLFDPLRPSRSIFCLFSFVIIPLCVVLCFKSCTFGNLMCWSCRVVLYE